MAYKTIKIDCKSIEVEYNKVNYQHIDTTDSNYMRSYDLEFKGSIVGHVLLDSSTKFRYTFNGKVFDSEKDILSKVYKDSISKAADTKSSTITDSKGGVLFVKKEVKHITHTPQRSKVWDFTHKFSIGDAVKVCVPFHDFNGLVCKVIDIDNISNMYIVKADYRKDSFYESELEYQESCYSECVKRGVDEP